MSTRYGIEIVTGKLLKPARKNARPARGRHRQPRAVAVVDPGPGVHDAIADVDSDVVVDMELHHDWVTGYEAEVTITNFGSRPVREWYLEFGVAGRIVDLWDAVLVDDVAGRYHVTNDDHNALIRPGMAVTFGFQLQTSRIGQLQLTDVRLNGRYV